MVKAKPLPPIDELRKRLAYRSDGVLIWKRPDRRVGPGCAAGSLVRGYLRLKFNQRRYMVHRVIWAILKREDPLSFQIDHINGNKTDNRIENLRKATVSQNQYNKISEGFYFEKRMNKYRPVIITEHRKHSLGYFDTEEQAREAYLRAKEKLHGEFMPSDMKHELAQIDGPISQLNFFDD